MDANLGSYVGIQRPATNLCPKQFGNAFYAGAGSGLIRDGLSTYGETFLGSSSEFMQSNMGTYFSNPQYYFQVNGQYVWNKLKIILFPFLHRGHWTRISEPMGGGFSYKPPVHDINAPDLYIPLMAFGTYVVLTGFLLGFYGKFSPESLTLQLTKGLFVWLFQILLLKGLVYSLDGGEAPILDIVAYAGYTFASMSVSIASRICWSYAYYFMLPWICLCTSIFLVKTMKRVVFTGVRSHECTTRLHYLLLVVIAVQFPLFFWLGKCW